MKKPLKFQLTTMVLLAGMGFSVFGQDPFTELDAATSNQSSSDEQLAKEFETYEAQFNAEYKAYREQLESEYAAYKKIVQQETEKYSAELAEVWDQVELSSTKVWVDYSTDLNTKNRVDFENQTIKVEVTVRDNITVDDSTMRSRLRELITRNQAQAFERDRIAQAVETQSLAQIELLETAEVKPAPILLPLVTEKPKPTAKEIDTIVDAMMAEKSISEAQNSRGETVITVEVPIAAANVEDTKEHVKEEIAEAPVSEASPPKLKPVAPKTPSPRVMADLRVNKLPKPARQIHPFVTNNAEKSRLDTELVFAIIETESAFNPMAKSPIPAYGLMQIVPESAGIDATEQLFGKGRVLSPSYLYSTEKNIEIGATYLNILFYRYLKGVEHPTSRLYCVIAAYNTGSGNVAKAFTGKMRVRSALPAINQLSPEEVYNHLIENLPYAETQKYLEKVVKRIPKYDV